MGTSSDLSPDQTQIGWDAVVDTYEEAVEPFTLQFSEEALRLVNLKPRERVLDVAAGPGGLSIAAAKRGADVVSIDFSPAMTRRLRTRIAQENLVNVTAETMDGQSMDFSDDAFDAAFSVFGLIFFPDYAKGLHEIWRVLKPGGRAAIVAWSAPERISFLQGIMGALNTAVPSYQPPASPPVWLSLQDPKVFESEMKKAGFRQVSIHTLTRVWTAPSAKWLQARLPELSPGLSFIFDTLNANEIEAFGKVYIDQFGDGPASLEGEAHIGVGIK